MSLPALDSQPTLFGSIAAVARDLFSDDDRYRLLAERLVVEALMALGWREIDLAMHHKGHGLKVKIAQQLRAQTPMTHQWIADRLRMGSGSYVSSPVSIVSSDPSSDPGRCVPTKIHCDVAAGKVDGI